MDRKLKKILLRPLVRRQRNIADGHALILAYERLGRLADGLSVLTQIQEVLDNTRHSETSGSKIDPDSTEKQVLLARALYLSRQISKQEFVFYAVWPVEELHNERMFDGMYDNKLGHINNAIEEIREKHGLGPDDYWKIGEGPPEYIQLEKEWSLIERELFLNILKEFNLDELAELFQKNLKEFDNLRERGRRAVRHRDELPPAIRDIVIRYEEDAKLAAKAGAYSAAIVSLGSGLEGLLLLRCFRSKYKAIRIAKKLPRRRRPHYPEDPLTWTCDNLIQVCFEAGWLPQISTSYVKFNSDGLANMLRLMRNHLHPGRYARDKPWSETRERDYKDAHAIYIILLSKLGGIGPRKLKALVKNVTKETT